MTRGVFAGLLAAFALAAGSGVAQANANVGCGLGSMLWEGQKGLGFEVLAATTNGVLGTQTFGITTGTLGCDAPNQPIKAEHRIQMFAGANIDRLAREMALGEGEALEALAVLMSVEQADRPAFYALTQAQFVAIFPRSEMTSGEMLVALNRVMADDARLARYAWM
jgi:hypothetical protein